MDLVTKKLFQFYYTYLEFSQFSRRPWNHLRGKRTCECQKQTALKRDRFYVASMTRHVDNSFCPKIATFPQFDVWLNAGIFYIFLSSDTDRACQKGKESDDLIVHGSVTRYGPRTSCHRCNWLMIAGVSDSWQTRELSLSHSIVAERYKRLIIPR